MKDNLDQYHQAIINGRVHKQSVLTFNQYEILLFIMLTTNFVKVLSKYT